MPQEKHRIGIIIFTRRKVRFEYYQTRDTLSEWKYISRYVRQVVALLGRVVDLVEERKLYFLIRMLL